MKPASYARFAAGALTLGLLAGCTNLPVRQSTLEFSADQIALATDAGIVAPAPLRTVSPFYPSEYKRAGITGKVLIGCVVDASGRVRDAEVKKTTDSTLALYALDAIEQWTFQPATRDGIPVPMRVNVPFVFRLEN